MAAAVFLLLISAANVVNAEPDLRRLGSQAGPSGTFDVTVEGRVIAMVGDDVVLETGVGTGIYERVGSFAPGLISPFGASFINVSPDGRQLAVGDNNFGFGHVFLVGMDQLTGGILAPRPFLLENFQAAWMDDQRLAVTLADPATFLGEVAVLDIDSGLVTWILRLGGASAGIAFDSAGRMLTGNGFDLLPGGSETGEIRGFDARRIADILNGTADPIDFETEGHIVADLLSASGLGFDALGDLWVGGGDFFGQPPDFEYFAVIDADAVADALAGMGPVGPEDIFTDDPESALFSNYFLRFNPVTDELLVGAAGNSVLYRYLVVPSPAGFGLLAVSWLFFTRRRRRAEVSFFGRDGGRISNVGDHSANSRGCCATRSKARWSSVLRSVCLAVVALIPCAAASGQHTVSVVPPPSPFATRVIDYSPGKGQFVNDPRFNQPHRALGAPVGGGTIISDNSKLVTLGGFGGSITLGFDRTIWDDPRNPFGLDAIVFGNAFWLGGDPDVRWAEAAVVEISRDANFNGLADDPWFVIPGSDLPDPLNQRRNGFFLLPDEPYANPPIVNPDPSGNETYWGYADMSPTLLKGDMNGDNIVDLPNIAPEWFYTVPDDPLRVGVTLGSGGGDAFDIAWAVDPVTNEPARLDGFDFIRITSAVDLPNGRFGEVSAEIGAVAAVRPMVVVHFVQY